MSYRARLVLVCLFVIVLLAAPCSSPAQQAQPSSYQAMTDHFFAMVKEGKGPEAIDYLFDTNPALKKVPDQVQQLKSQFATLPALVGPYMAHAKLAETKVAGMFVYQHYFVAYERQPISIRIKYYKPGAVWLCHGLQFDVELPDTIQKQTDSSITFDGK
jgi:hypothetical protein